MTFGEEAAPSPKKATVGNDDVKEPQMDRFDEGMFVIRITLRNYRLLNNDVWLMQC